MHKNNRSLTFIMDGNFNELNGEFYSPHMHYNAFLGRYTPHFGKVRLFSRAFQKQGDAGNLVARDNAEFFKIGSYRGGLGFLKSLPDLFRSLCRAIDTSDIILLRFPGNISSLALLACEIKRKNYSIEIVAEPRDYFSKHSSTIKLRWFAKIFHTSLTALAAKRAVTVRYVTSRYLQKNYPSSTTAKTFGFSDVFLPSISPNKPVPRNKTIRIINVAMMHNHSKGHLVLFKSLRMLKDDDIAFTCHLIGDGVLRNELEQKISAHNLTDSVKFFGLVSPSEKVWSHLSESDIFVLPSFQEGMPRSLLEAMQLGLACIATDVGGISEALPGNMLVSAGDHISLYKKLKQVIESPQALLDSAKMCTDAVKMFSPEALDEKNKKYVASLLSEHE